MSPRPPIPDESHASALARASRRLRMVIDLGDMAMTLARAVHERALAEEAAAKAGLAVREAAEAEPREKPPAPSQAVPAKSAPSRAARSDDQTRRPAPRARVRAGSGAAGSAPVMDAGALFARLSDIVRQCLELEIRIDEDLRRLAAAAFVTHEADATLHGRIDDVPCDASLQEALHQEASHREVPDQDPARRQYDARNRIGVMVEAVIEEQVKTWREARQLYDALRQLLDAHAARDDLESLPDAVRAAGLCRDLGLHADPARWPRPPPDP